ncbi:MAG: tryptophan synthase subunit alpha [Candidatus Omnitrophica bacterium]|nr:tryptophan synthase subunit alpha [Candidatus Omnitrophota bacterium]
MNRIDRKFSDLKARNKKAFIAFITAGDPSLAATEALVPVLGQAGADIIELGVPFSDPMADGRTIQEASFRALQGGTTPAGILAMVRRLRKVTEVPIALMTYYNPVFHFGEEQFVAQAKAAGVDGLIIPDLPVTEAAVLRKAAAKHDLALVFFLAPTTTSARMAGIVRAASGFVYFVSVAGVTGASVLVAKDIARKVQMARAMSGVPVCVGFGISTPQQVKEIAGFADGVIVGSAIVKEVAKYSGAQDMPARVAVFVKSLSSVL